MKFVTLTGSTNEHPRTAMISGHRDITGKEFEQHYRQRIDNAIKANHRFVVGDAPGVDRIALRYLLSKGAHVTLYHPFEYPRVPHPRNLPCRGGYASYKERDAAMTAASDYDIAWVRPGRENSGTAYNIRRRKYRR